MRHSLNLHKIIKLMASRTFYWLIGEILHHSDRFGTIGVMIFVLLTVLGAPIDLFFSWDFFAIDNFAVYFSSIVWDWFVNSKTVINLIEISDIPETSIVQIRFWSSLCGFLANFWMNQFATRDGRAKRERDGKSWELCNWDGDYDDDSVEIKHEDLRNPNSFLLSSFFARRFL